MNSVWANSDIGPYAFVYETEQCYLVFIKRTGKFVYIFFFEKAGNHIADSAVYCKYLRGKPLFSFLRKNAAVFGIERHKEKKQLLLQGRTKKVEML